MYPALRRLLTRSAVVAAIGLLPAACGDNGGGPGPDAPLPPESATLTVTRNGTSTGMVASSPGGIACGAACSADFPVGSLVTLIATPDPGAELAGWSGGGCSGTAPTCTVTVDAATTVTATFDIARYPVTIELGGSGSGMVVAPAAGISCPGTCSAMVEHGSELSLDASAGASSLFMGWTVGPGGTACTGTGACATTITGPTTVTATFALQHALEVTRSGTGSGTVTSSPAGIDCGADCSELYLPGTTVTLTATAAGDSTFMGWTGGGCSGAGTCEVTVTAATTVTATFTLNSHALSVFKGGTGGGTVTSSPAGIDCGSSCSATYSHGTMVTLTATPSASSTFTTWSGGGCSGTGPCTVTMTAATFVTAVFTLEQYTLSVIKNGSGGGGVTSVPAGINCSPMCNGVFPHGTVVTLTATPAMFSIFGGWSRGGCSGTGTCEVTMTGDTTVGANFQQPTFTLSVSKAGGGSGTVTSAPGPINCGATCSGAFLNGTTVVLTATPAVGSVFAGWTGAGCTGTGTCSVLITANTAVTASFVPALTTPQGSSGATLRTTTSDED